jgi:hypothetical protein
MLSASPNFRGLASMPGVAWQRTRATVTGSVLWSALLVFLLTFAVARSTATAAWVTGIDVVPMVALGGALVMAVLAVAPIPWGIGLAVGMVAGPIVAVLVAWPALHAAHYPALLSANGLSTSAGSAWWEKIASGAAAQDPAFYLFLICWLMWVTGGWLSWCVLRWRRPMLGLIPGAAAFATNLLNFPADQNGYTLTILVLTLGLLLWTNYTASIANATRARVKLTGDARWDFWESGLVAMAALIVLGIMLPPLSTVDRTVQIESSAFSQWALLQERLSHPGLFNNGTGAGGTTGFSTVVQLGGSLTRTRDVVFTYTITGDFAGPRYFRGVNETQTAGGAWRYPQTVALKDALPRNTIPVYAEDYKKLALAAFNVKMVLPPIGNNDILFYPGLLYKADRPTIANEAIIPISSPNGLLTTIDRLSSGQPATSAGRYLVSVEYSTATEEDLRASGTNYPDWVSAYMGLPDTGYRSPQVIERIHQLALSVTEAAGAVTPYDKAVAVESYLRSNYVYTLNVPQTPRGTDPLEYFLFTSKRGYCEYYASAMGDMLRTLGVPTRLVNGYGPGQFDNTIQSYVVRGEDAHSWVETYFPNYGWIPFEPTADGTYLPITRGAQGPGICLRDFGCPDPGGSTGGPGVLPVPTGRSGGNVDPGATGGGSAQIRFRIPDAGTLTKILGIVLAVVLVVFAAAARYLRPRSVMTVWKRTITLSRLAGAERRGGETPLEMGRRLERTFPEAAEPLRTLASGFVVSAYAPPEVAETARPSIMEAWTNLRPMLLRRLLARLRPNRG